VRCLFGTRAAVINTELSLEIYMAGNVLPVLVLASVISTIAGSAAAYKGSPKGKKWLALMPVAALILFLFVSAAVLAYLIGAKKIDIETARVIMMGLCALLTAINIFFFMKFR